MKLKLNTENGFVVIETNTVTNFGPYLDEGKNDTRIEHLSANGELKTEIVKHDFYKVTSALATLWSLDDTANKAG
ncbi:hypothetical protein ACQV2B_02760 [Pantoea allii]|uniref:hypothetical protein n=1 Tax=Pantoea allii TaxID=574096 RepID=UPI003D31470C